MVSKKQVVPPLEAMQQLTEFYHNERIEMLKLRCTLPNLAYMCLHKSTNSNFYPFTELDKNFLGKIREKMVYGPSIVFTAKLKWMKLLFGNQRISANLMLVLMLVSFFHTQ